LNKPEFIRLLQNPEHISPQDTTELAVVVQRFPYFQSARALHLKGLKQLESLDYNRALKISAAYIADRSILFDFITSKTFNQNKISLAIKHNSEQLKSIAVHGHEDISVNHSVTIDESLKQQIKNTDGVLDPNLFENKTSSESYQGTNNEALPEVDSTNHEVTPEDTLKLGKPLEFAKNETHSFAEWLKLTSFKPIDRTEPNTTAQPEKPVKEKTEKSNNSYTAQNQTLEKKYRLIDNFLKKNPKIVPKKDGTTSKVKNTSDTSSDELMTETLARIYLEQRNYEKAIQSYKILSLKYPEKSGFFADQIKAVEKLRDNKEQ